MTWELCEDQNWPGKFRSIRDTSTMPYTDVAFFMREEDARYVMGLIKENKRLREALQYAELEDAY